MLWIGVAGSSSVLVLWRGRSRDLCQGEQGGHGQFAADQSQSALCAGDPPNSGDRGEGPGGRGTCMAGIVKHGNRGLLASQGRQRGGSNGKPTASGIIA